MEKGLNMETTKPLPRFRRKQYLVKARFQLSYVGLIMSLIIITACVCSYVVYYTSLITLGEKLAAVYPQGRIVSIVQMVNSRILISIILISPFIFVVGVYFSHKIAGPIYRIEHFLNDMANGDLSRTLILRKGDELVSLADGINDVRQSFISMIDGDKEKLDAIIADIEEARHSIPPEPKYCAALKDSITYIYNEAHALKTSLDKYKLR